ncbi:MAG TPA: two-component regulator propeller domain-containing protein [Nitrospiria bacterium]|nr:two-component regulator propeller domain-containing protein [Nitrospiria bacterium]
MKSTRRKTNAPLRFFVAVVLAGSALVFSSCALRRPPPEPDIVAETPPYGPISWAAFNTHDDPVRTMAMDGDDLWLGTMKGIIRFNPRKKEYEIFTPANTEGGFIARAVYILSVDPKGNKWVGTYGGGLSRYDGHAWKRFSTDDGLGDNWVYDIKYDRDGKMWVATWNGVSVLEGERFRTYRVADGLPDKWVYSIAYDRDGVFWFGTEAGISRFDGKSWKTYSHKDGVGGEIGESPAGARPASPFPDPEATEEGAGGGYGSSILEHHLKMGKQNAGPNPDFIISSLVDDRNRRWFGTWGGGVARFDGAAWTNYTAKDGLGGDFVFTMASDREGHVWAGTNGGASWFDGTRWRTINRSKGLMDDYVFSILFDPKGRRWFGTTKGLSVFKGSLPAE